MAWLPGYTYRKKGSVVATAAGAQTAYQLKLLVGESSGAAGEDVDCEGHCHDFQNDIRFTDTDGTTKHDYWVESITGVTPNRLATIQIEVATIPAAGSVDSYMYYGKSNDNGESNGDNTFEFFDDFDLPSFRGIWYQNGDYYHGPMATFSAKHRPMAIYVPSQNKTYFTYGAYDDSARISYYDHSNESFHYPVSVESLSDDNAHRNPAILIDEDGYIYIFYGSHNSTCFCKKSSSAYNISSWDIKASIADHTYPQAWQLKSGEIIHIYRRLDSSIRRIASRKSTDGVTSWSSYTDIVNWGSSNLWPYGISIAETGDFTRKLHLAWTIYDSSGPTRGDIFYAKTEDGGTTWKEANDTNYTLPISSSNAEKVFESGTDDCYMKDIQLDSSGNVYILFSTGSGTSWTVKLAKYSGGSWSSYSVCAHDHPFDTGALVILASNDFRVYFPSTSVQANNDGGEIEEWQSIDGGENWSNTDHITSSSTYSHNYVRSVFNSASDGKFRVFWGYADSIKDTVNTDVDLYMYGESQASAVKLPALDSLDSTKWTLLQGEILQNDGNAELIGTAGTRGSAEQKTANYPSFLYRALRTRIKGSDNTPGQHHIAMRKPGVTTEIGGDIYMSEANANQVSSWTEKNDTHEIYINNNQDVANWNIWDFLWKAGETKFYRNGNLVKTHNLQVSDQNNVVWLYEGSLGGTLYIDWIFIRKYAFPEPTWGTWGSEEVGVGRTRSYAFIIG